MSDVTVILCTFLKENKSVMSGFSLYFLFLAKVATLVVAILLLVLGVCALVAAAKKKSVGQLQIRSLHQHYQEMTELLVKAAYTKTEFKAYQKKKKQEQETHKKQEKRARCFVITFNGDLRASAVSALREEITAILTIATAVDEVVVRLESGGGMVHSYGLAASQLQRICEHQIPLTVIIDKVAASGGYLMACVAPKIIAAPFAVLGSIGVVAQLPNFNRWLKRHNIDFELHTAGEYKRTLTMFGENTEKGREKFQQELEMIHNQFKEFLTRHRPQIDLAIVATGEYWLGERAKQLQLIDEIGTSDDYLMHAVQRLDVYEVCYQKKPTLLEKLGHQMHMAWQNIVGGISRGT